MKTLVTSSERPPYKIRLYPDGWRLTKFVVWDGHEVECFIGVFRTQPIALAVMDADAGPDNYPLFRELIGMDVGDIL